MAVYSELIKNFDKVREYVRDFYIFGFRTREDRTEKSKRTYDNERRRIESWLGDHIHTEQTGHRKKISVKIDSSHIYQNPLYKCYKSKSFTDNDIKLHFLILDMLTDKEMTASEITDKIADEYGMIFDLQTVRLKLKEYADEGLLIQKKNGKAVVFGKSDLYIKKLTDEHPLLSEMIAFFSEEIPFGVIGSFIMDKEGKVNRLFTRKHAYMVHTLDDEMLLPIAEAIKEKRDVTLSCVGVKNGNKFDITGVPLKIHSSTQTGRNYVVMYKYERQRLISIRIDSIIKVQIGDICESYDKYYGYYEKNVPCLWGTSFDGANKYGHTEHIHMEIILDEEKEQFILKRLEREGRGGTVTKISEGRYAYDIDVFDASEVSPWIKTFIGRIAYFESTNKIYNNRYYADVRRLYKIYGGD